MVLGGFLMLPTTFEHQSELRVSRTVVGISAAAILAGGFSFTGLLTFAVRDATFQNDLVFLPGLVSCSVGLLTVLYSFLISDRYYWNTTAYLSVAVAVLGMLAYAGLMAYNYRKTRRVRRLRQSVTSGMPPVESEESRSRSTETLVPREPRSPYYDNYIRNMYPASVNSPPPPAPRGYDPNTISEEEMQRQQMLMLLLNGNQTQIVTPNASQSTFRIDWQGQEQDQEEFTPITGSYMGGTHSTTSSSSFYPLSGLSSQFSNQTLQPWDGVWRDPMPASMQAPGRAQVAGWDVREERRRQIESGR